MPSSFTFAFTSTSVVINNKKSVIVKSSQKNLGKEFKTFDRPLSQIKKKGSRIELEWLTPLCNSIQNADCLGVLSVRMDEWMNEWMHEIVVPGKK